MRSRWAAIGAAVAVTLGAGGLVSVSADTDTSVFVAVTPTRVLDTRVNVGLAGVFAGGVARKLDVTGSIAVVEAGGTVTNRVVVPDGATAIVANLTAAEPTARGFVSIRPGSATGRPTTSNINVPGPGVNIPNSVTVEIPTSGPNVGFVDLFYSPAGQTTHLLLDVVGYYVDADAAFVTQAEQDAALSEISPANVLWVARDGTGNFALLSEALASITDASAANPYLIRIAPGTYDEPAPVVTKDHVDIEGSGEAITVLRCSTGCASTNIGPASAVMFLSSATEVRNLTVVNEGNGTYGFGIHSSGSDPKSLLHTSVVVAGPPIPIGVYNEASSPTMSDVAVVVDDGSLAFGVYNVNSSPVMTDVSIAVRDALVDGYGIGNGSSSPVMTNVKVTVSATDETFGISNSEGSKPVLTDVTVSASGALTDYGVHSSSSSSVTIRGSQITGESFSVFNVNPATAKVADTMLNGPVSGPGFLCVGAYNQAFGALTQNCT